MVTPQPLAGFRVVELASGLAPAYAGKLYADAGAEVWLVEPAGGDPLRGWRAGGAVPDGEDGALFRFLAASKRSVVGELGDPVVSGLIGAADLVVEALPVGRVEEAGLLDQPGLVVASISPFGRGSWQGRTASELTVQAVSGSLAARLYPEGPLQAGGRISEWASGAFAAAASLAAVRDARRRGRGTHIDLSMAEVMCICTNLFLDLMWDLLERPDMGELGASTEFPAVEATADGWVGFNTNSAQMFEDFLVMVDRTDLSGDATLRSDPVRRAGLEETTREWCAARTTDEIVELAALLRVPAVPVGNGANLPANEHLAERGAFAQSPYGFTYPRPPYRLNGEVRPDAGPAPAPDADRDAAVALRGERRLAAGATAARAGAPTTTGPAATGATAARAGAPTTTGPAATGATAARAGAPTTMGLYPGGASAASAGADDLPMAGLKVLDLTCWWAGPGATQLMAGLGADVIHVEAIQRMDGMRPAATLIFTDRDQWWEYSPFFLTINTNKRGITLDLESDEGLELVKGLIRWADVVIENYTPRVMERFGLDADGIAAVNPAAVVVRMPAFGLDGPWRDRVGFAQTMEAMCGMVWLTGMPDQPPRLPRGPCDPIGAMHAAFATLAALTERERTGEGQTIEAALLESGLNVAAEQVIEWSAYGRLLERAGNRSPGVAPQGVFSCRDGRIAVSVLDDAQWAALTRVMADAQSADRADWAARSDLSSVAGRSAVQDELEEGLATWAAEQEAEAAVGSLLAAGVPAAVVADFRNLSRHPLFIERGFFERCQHPVVGDRPMFGMPFHWAGIEKWIRSPAPMIGQHNHEVLTDLLGLSPEQLAELESRQVIGTRPLGI